MIAPDCRRCDRRAPWHPEVCDCGCHAYDLQRGLFNGVLVTLMLGALAVALYYIVT